MPLFMSCLAGNGGSNTIIQLTDTATSQAENLDFTCQDLEGKLVDMLIFNSRFLHKRLLWQLFTIPQTNFIFIITELCYLKIVGDSIKII